MIPNGLWEPIQFFGPSIQQLVVDQVDPAAATKEAVKEETSGLNLDFFMSDDAKIKGQEDLLEKEMKTQERRAKREAAKTAQEMTPVQAPESVPYIDTYSGTNAMLMQTIADADQLSKDIRSDIDQIRASKSLKGKYTYLTNLTGAAASVMSARLQAIKEINSSITQSHNLELKRTADQKRFESEKQNDDARMMDMYNAFINAPMGMYDNALHMPKPHEMMLGPNEVNVSGISGMAIGQVAQSGGMTPEQYRMQMEESNRYEEVVVYDPASNARWFDVVDKVTGQSVPNMPRSDNFLLEDITIESRAGIAKHRNLDKVWPLRTVGGVNIMEY